MNTIEKIQKWYLLQCDGAWEREYGISISAVGNPGWSVEIDLRYTNLENRKFCAFNKQREDENDWIICSIHEYKFLGSGGPENLEEILITFLKWAYDE